MKIVKETKRRFVHVFICIDVMERTRKKERCCLLVDCRLCRDSGPLGINADSVRACEYLRSRRYWGRKVAFPRVH